MTGADPVVAGSEVVTVARQSRHTVTISDEAWQLIEWAKAELIKRDRRHTPTRREALDWLLRDLCEYGSPVVGHQARKTWPDSAETRSWTRRFGDPKSSASSTVKLCTNGSPVHDFKGQSTCPACGWGGIVTNDA